MLGSDNTTAMIPIAAADIKPRRHRGGLSRFEVFKARDGWRWHLVAANGEIIAQGEAYKTLYNVRRGIKKLRISALEAVGPVVVNK